MSRASILVVLLLSVGCMRTDRVNPIAPEETKVDDPEYVGLYRSLGDSHLKKGEYRRAWREYAALGDFTALRKLIRTYAADSERFSPPLFDSMIEQFAAARLKDNPKRKPLTALNTELGPVADAHAKSGQIDRARIAWAIRRSCFLHLPEFEDRKAYYEQVRALRKALEGSSSGDVKAFAAEVADEMRRIEVDHHGKL